MADTPAVANLAIEPAATGRAETVGTTRDYLRALSGDAGGKLAIGFLVLLVLLAISASGLTPHRPETMLGPEKLKSLPPSWTYPFGTDLLSRDVLTRMLFATRISLRIALLAAGLAGVVGLFWGAAAGYIGGAVDAFLMRTVDALLAIPRVLLVITVIALWPDRSPGMLILVLGLTGWFGVSRLARAQALGLRNREFVHAALALGVSRVRILVRHVIPHALGPVLVATTLGVGQVLVLEAGLTYLGLGVQPPTASWGSIIADGSSSLLQTWWLTLFPGMALIGTSLAVNAIANRLRVVIHPRQLPGR